MIRHISLLNLAVFKYSIENGKNYFETYEEDAEAVYNTFKQMYGDKKGTDAPYVSNLKNLIDGNKEYFD